MRQIVLDTETTGLDPAAGHRIIEIGCLELLNRKTTGNRFHVYLNPEREVDAGAVEVHGLSNDFLADKPRFAETVDDFLRFIDGAELVIHNAPFDVGFLNHEFSLLEGYQTLDAYCGVLDTLAMARKKHPGQRNSLDALCKRYNVDNKHRSLHGALLDAEILAEVYLAMTGGQTLLILEPDTTSGSLTDHAEGALFPIVPGAERPLLNVIRCSESEMTEHEQLLALIDKTSGGQCVWERTPSGN